MDALIQSALFTQAARHGSISEGHLQRYSSFLEVARGYRGAQSGLKATCSREQQYFAEWPPWSSIMPNFMTTVRLLSNRRATTEPSFRKAGTQRPSPKVLGQ